jgi:hypothetical protein
LATTQAAVTTDDLLDNRLPVALQALQYLAEAGGTSVA